MSEPLKLFVIYDHPSDFPGNFVVRQWLVRPLEPTECVHLYSQVVWVGDARYVNEPVEPAYTFETLEAARAHASAGGRVCVTRNAEDDPKIVETWL